MLKAEDDNAGFNLEESVAEAPVSDDNRFRGGDFYSVNSSNDFYSKSGSNIYGGGSGIFMGHLLEGGMRLVARTSRGVFIIQLVSMARELESQEGRVRSWSLRA
jgi:hypothetical protein